MTHPNSFTPEIDSNGHPIIPDWAEEVTRNDYVDGEKVWIFSKLMDVFEIIIGPHFDSDYPYIRAKRQPEKQGERMGDERKFSIEIEQPHIAGRHYTLATISEIERAYAEVQAWKEKQKAEKEIKVGDWVRHDCGLIGKPTEVRFNTLWFEGDVTLSKDRFTKITDPDLLAALNKAYPA